MPNIFEHIKKAFNKPPLGDEDWLEPSDRVLANIENAIGEDKKGDNSHLVLYLLFTVLLGGILYLLFFNPINNEFSNNKESLQKKKDKSSILTNNEPKASNESVNEEYTKSNRSEANFTKENKGDTKPISNPILSRKTKGLIIQEKNGIQNSLDRPSEPRQHKESHFKSIEKSFNGAGNSIIENNYTDIIVELQEVLSSDINTDVPENDNHISEVFSSTYLTQLPIASLDIFDEEINIRSNVLGVPSADINVNSFIPKFFIEAGIGMTYWNFRLNDEYKSAVESAAFENSNGLGYITSLAVGREINSRVSLSVQGSYESINFNSGHNSNITYNNDLSEQTENLTIATPLGLVNNQVALFRTADGSTDQTNLIIDLKNEHQLTAVGFSMNANIKIIQSNKFSIAVTPGIGIQHILSTANELVSVNTNNVDIINGGIIAKGNFENVNNTSPFTSLYFALERNLSDHWQMGLTFGSSLQLNPIQETMALKTNVVRYNTQLVFRRSF